MRAKRLMSVASVLTILSIILANSYFMAYLFPYGKGFLYHERYEQLAQTALQNNTVIVSANARLIWVLSDFKLDVIDLGELANKRNIDNASAQLLGSWILSYLRSGRTVLYVVTSFEINQHSEYGNFKNDFSFFLNWVSRSFNVSRVPGELVPPPEYALRISAQSG